MSEPLRRRLVGGLVLIGVLWLLAFLLPPPQSAEEREDDTVVIDLRTGEVIAESPSNPTPADVLPPPELPALEASPPTVVAAPTPLARPATAAPVPTPATAPPATPRSSPAASPRPAPTPPPPAAPLAGWWVQVGAYASREGAEQVRESLRVAGLPAVVQTIGSGAREVHRVRIGPHADRTQAESAQARAVLLGYTQATVLRVEGGP